MVVMEAGRAGWWPVAIKSCVDKGLNSTDTTAKQARVAFPSTIVLIYMESSMRFKLGPLGSGLADLRASVSP